MEQVTSADGTTIAYDRLGAGAPLILVAGASCDRQADAGLAASLSAHFTVFNYDRRGRGDSSDTQPFAVDREIEDIGALLGAAGAGALLVGLSSGAALAARAAAQLPVAGLVMWEPPFTVDDDGLAAARAYTAALTERLAAGDADGAFEAFLRRVGMPDEAIAGARQAPFWAGAVRLAPTLAYDDAALNGGPVPAEVFAGIAVPTVVLAGGASPDSLQAGARAAADAIPGASFAVLEGQTHDADPDALTAAIVPFAAQAAG
ncbi:alpha/beta fold hydrolase [Sinomonas albida]|uniref:alpha/beta fold hydrolase n=1 Tax=Sinomonas albida TaxID=369942 RepID=UPI0010A84154|nr:alpha/beta hydrolase [Sinomonas albida]